MKNQKKQIPLKMEMKYFEKLAKHQVKMGKISMTQVIKNLIMGQAQSKASDHILALCTYSAAVISNLELILESNFSEEEKKERLKDLGIYQGRINRILRKYNY